jgi:hypothetical protein
MRTFKWVIVCTTAVAGIALCAPAVADVADYHSPAAYVVGDSVTDLAVTPDGRFVLVLDSASWSLRFLDTWDFTVLAGGTAVVSLDDGGGDPPLCLAVSANSGYAYAGIEDGYVAIINLSVLDDRLPGGTLAAEPPVTYFEVSANGNPVEYITVAPDKDGGKTNDYVLFGVPLDQRMYWVMFSAGQAQTVSRVAFNAVNPLVHTTLGLATGGAFAYNLYSLSNETYLLPVTCSDSNHMCAEASVTPLNLSGLGSNLKFRGLAAGANAGDYVLAGNTTERSLWLIDTQDLSAMAVSDTVTVNIQPFEIAVVGEKTTGQKIPPTALAVNDQIENAGVDISTMDLLFGTVDYGTWPTDITSIAASNSVDRFAYVGRNGISGLVDVFTANPWVDALTASTVTVQDTSGGSTATVTDGFTLGFTIISLDPGKITYKIYQDESFGQWTSLVAGSSTFRDTPVNEYIGVSAAGLNECENILTVVTEDTNERKGRMAIVVDVDTVPPPQGFTLDFGDRKLIYDFDARGDVCDLAGYQIYYGTTVGVSDYNGLINNSSLFDSPPAIPNQNFSDEITGLTNGMTYWVWVVIFDEKGNLHMGSPQSGIPQPTTTLTEMTDEDGGVNCLPAVSGGKRGDPRSAAWFLAPLLAAGAYRAARRWRR